MMNEKPINREIAVMRLTALWGLTEAGLGGVIHALRIPFTGIVVGSTAIILITLIAYFGQRRASVILRSMMIVLLIKAGASPHTPLPAYIAVVFQGVMASLLFNILPGIRLPAMILGVVSLVEGVCQKFVVMTLLYGKSVWEAIDLIGKKLGVRWGIDLGMEHASWWLIGVFFIYYGVGGVVVGWLAGRVPGRINRMLAEYASHTISLAEEDVLPERSGIRRKWRYRRLMPALVIMLVLFGVFTLSSSGESSWQKGVYILLRTVGILVMWFLLVGPLVRRWIAYLHRRETNAYAQELQQALNLMPQLRRLAAQVWIETEKENRFVRWYHFMTRMVVYSILYEQ